MSNSEDVLRSLSLLRATLDATAEGILVVDLEGRAVLHNRRLVEVWQLSEEEVVSWSEGRGAMEALAARTVDPAGFLPPPEATPDDPTILVLDTVELGDGRRIERRSRPQRMGGEVVGRVWSFRDVTEVFRANRAFRESESRYRRLFRNSPHAVYVTGADGTFIEANPAALRLFGLTRDTMHSWKSVDLYVDPAERREFEAEIARSRSVVDYPVRLKDVSGREMHCLLTSAARRTGDGEIGGYEGIVQDITNRHDAEKTLRRSEQKFRALIEHASDTITILDEAGVIQYESPSLQRVLGHRPEDLVGRSVFEFVHPDDVAAAGGRFAQLIGIEGAMVRVEVRFLHANGSWRWMEVTARNLLAHSAVGGVVVNARDISDRRTAEKQLLHDAFHDRLTGLPNRALLLDRIHKLLARSQRDDAPPFAVLFLDVDRFKVVNDSLGHHVGDQLLTVLARRLQTCLRPGDTVARLGGDEFTMLLDGVDVAEATVVADRIRSELRTPFELGGHEVFTTVSVGISTSASSYAGPEEMLRDADLAMYSAKESERGSWQVFDSGMRDQAVERLSLETDLRRAIERGEFTLRYQPIVSMKDERLTGFEALLRWEHPERGELLPGDFLQLAEDTGQILPIGWWVLSEVCRRIAGWRRAGLEVVPVRVNVSAHQLARGALADRVEEALSEHGCPAKFLHLELTESTMMENAESTVRTLDRLKRISVGLAIDDFGTGYSSLSYLHRFATDSVKIDRSFVERITEREEDHRLVRTIIDLAHDLGMSVVSEGIERREQATLLQDLGSDEGQGFLYGRPLAVADAEGLLD